MPLQQLCLLDDQSYGFMHRGDETLMPLQQPRLQTSRRSTSSLHDLPLYDGSIYILIAGGCNYSKRLLVLHGVPSIYYILLL
jgi:hypothetical protein